VNQAQGTQLMALELQTCYLVHPDWLPLSKAEFTNITQCCPHHEGFELVLSRHLMDTHRLPPLTPDLFSHDWTYCVVGGHRAMEALTQQVTSYLIATMVKSTISGVQARALSSQLGPTVYEQLLQSEQSLFMWAAPKSTPANTVEFLAEKSRVLVDGLWLHHSPGLADWARLMSRAVQKKWDTCAEFVTPETQGLAPTLPYSLALLDEINQRLQIDFSIDAAEIFKSFAITVSPSAQTKLPSPQ
jgi:hypothetical protein